MTTIRDLLPDPLPTTTTSQRILAPSPSSPTSAAVTKRLSFLSYADLLTSTPTSTLPLSSLTTAASVIEPPPHITGVTVPSTNLTFGSHPGSATTSLRGFVMGPVSLSGGTSNATATNSNGMHVATDAFGPLVPLTSPVPVPMRKDSVGMTALDDVVGGEWEREGLGKGLEERMDVLYGTA